MDDQYDWIATSGDFGTATNWEDVTTNANPAPNPPGSLDTAVFGTGGGTITGIGTVSTLDVNPGTAFTFAGNFTTGTFDVYAPAVDTGTISALDAYLLDDLTISGVFNATGTSFGIASYAGTLTIQDGAAVTASDVLEEGNTADLLLQSGATLTLTGIPSNYGTAGLLGLDIEGVATIDGATLNSLSGFDVIGQTQTVNSPAQTADLTVQDGAKVQSDKTVIGATADETGTLTITGSLTDYTITQNSSINGADGNMIVGGASQTGIANPGGTGDLVVTNGASLHNDGNAIFGLLPTSATATTDGVATISDGAIWNIGSVLLVGDDTGATALLSIEAGGTVSSSNPSTLDAASAVIADQVGTNGTISVSGAGATLDAGVNTFVIGQYGDGTLTISNGGAVTANTDTPSSDAAAIVGHEAGSTGVVTVSGTGSIFKVLQQFDVGSYGTGDVTVSNGGSLVTGNGTGGLILGFEQGTGTGFLTVNGGNVTNSGRFQVGGYGSGAMLIENGGTVTTSRASPSFSSPGAAIGDRTTGGAASVTVTGTGSTWNLANGPLVVSYGPASSLAIQAGGTVTANEVDVAAVANAIGTVTADGSGSRLSMRNDLSIAGNPAAAGGTGDVAVTNSAFVGAPLLYMWSGATLSDDATGTVEIGSLGGAAAGDITVDPGVVATGAGTIEGTVIDNGTLTDVRTSLTLTGTELGSGTLRMGGTADLVLDAAQGITGSISGFSTGQTLDLANVHFASVSLGYSGNTLTVTDGTTTANLDIGPGYTLGDFSTLADSNGGTEIFTSQVMPCYLAGSRILTTRGEIAVEALAVGNIAITASGRHAPIAWIGRREVDCRHHPQPERVMPVRIRAGAFGKATPSRDLLLSPDHAVLAESVLIPVRCLVEGVSIVQERVHRAAYFHVELDRHDLLVAEGLAAESYLDSGNRRQFANGGGSMSLHADFAASAREGACAPLVLCGTAVQRTRQRLRARATRRGGTTGPWVVVDGRAMRPAAVVNGRLRFILPAGSQEIRLPEEIGVMGLLADGRTLAEAAPGCWRLPAVRQPTPVVLELRLGSAADRVARAA